MNSIYILRFHLKDTLYKIVQTNETLQQIFQTQYDAKNIIYYHQILNPIVFKPSLMKYNLGGDIYNGNVNEMIDILSEIIKSGKENHSITQKSNGVLQNQFKKYSQQYFVAHIIENFSRQWISSKQINTLYSLLWMKHKFHLNDSITLKDIIQRTIFNQISLPGDVQRTLRTFYENFGVYNGVIQSKQKDGLMYMYNPKPDITKITRQRYFSKFVVQKALESCHNKCEVCDTIGTINNPLQADHWRSHSEYHMHTKDISSNKNCVMLCLKCNIIKSNHSSIVLVKKRRCSIERWKNIDTRVRIPPNQKEQKEIDEFIIKYNQCL